MKPIWLLACLLVSISTMSGATPPMPQPEPAPTPSPAPSHSTASSPEVPPTPGQVRAFEDIFDRIVNGSRQLNGSDDHCPSVGKVGGHDAIDRHCIEVLINSASQVAAVVAPSMQNILTNGDPSNLGVLWNATQCTAGNGNGGPGSTLSCEKESKDIAIQALSNPPLKTGPAKALTKDQVNSLRSGLWFTLDRTYLPDAQWGSACWTGTNNDLEPNCVTVLLNSAAEFADAFLPANEASRFKDSLGLFADCTSGGGWADKDCVKKAVAAAEHELQTWDVKVIMSGTPDPNGGEQASSAGGNSPQNNSQPDGVPMGGDGGNGSSSASGHGTYCGKDVGKPDDSQYVYLVKDGAAPSPVADCGAAGACQSDGSGHAACQASSAGDPKTSGFAHACQFQTGLYCGDYNGGTSGILYWCHAGQMTPVANCAVNGGTCTNAGAYKDDYCQGAGSQ